MMNNKFTFENIYIENFDINYKKVRNLTEEKKFDIADKTLAKLLKITRKKIKKDEYKYIEKSKGDISKFNDAKLIQDSIANLKRLAANSNSSVYKDNLNAIDTCYSILKFYTNDFKKAFSSNNSIAILFYDSLVISLINLITFAYTNFVNYNFDNYGLLSITIMEKSSNIEKKLKSNINYKSVMKFSDLQKNGKIKSVFNFSVSINEAVDLNNLDIKEMQKKLEKPLENLGDFYSKHKKLLGAAAIAMIVVFLFISIRNIVFYFYYTRLALKEKLNFIKENLEANIGILEKNNDNKPTIEKQKKKVEKINKWMKILDYDDEKSNKEAEQETQKEDKEIATETNTELDDDIV